MSEMISIIERKRKFILFVFFAALLFLGLNIFDNYGIGWDEDAQIVTGMMNFKYITEGDKALLTYKDRDYGPAFEILLTCLNNILNRKQSLRNIFFIRHFVTFFVFYIAVFFFYLLCKKRFGDWKTGLLGSLFLILSPRIFAHSFYNSKDIPFLSLFIISIYLLIVYLEKKTFLAAFLHALVNAFLIDIRIAGLAVTVFTLVFMASDMLMARRRKEKNSGASSIFAYIFFLICFVVLFRPILWTNPFLIVNVIKNMAHFRCDLPILYMGRYVDSTALPWHYIPVWMIVTTPVAYILFFFIGCLFSAKSFLRHPVKFYDTNKNDLIFISWLFVPPLVAAVFKFVLYDGYRHMFFIYPAMLMTALVGMVESFGFIKSRLKATNYEIASLALSLYIAASLIWVAKFMIQYHPFQNVYFNMLAGKDMMSAKKNFEMDYWGVSYKDALEYILENDADENIKIFVYNTPGKMNANILPRDKRKRIEFVDSPRKAKYFLSNYRWQKREYPFTEFYSIKIGNAKIMVVYKLH